jgi:hypothetical protein
LINEINSARPKAKLDDQIKIAALMSKDYESFIRKHVKEEKFNTVLLDLEESERFFKSQFHTTTVKTEIKEEVIALAASSRFETTKKQQSRQSNYNTKPQRRLPCSYCKKHNHNPNHSESRCFWLHPHLKPSYNIKNPLSIEPEPKHKMYQLSVEDEAKCTATVAENRSNIFGKLGGSFI